MSVDIRIVESSAAEMLTRVADGVFDNAVDAKLWAEFLADTRHHLCVAIDEGVVVGFASAVHYVHPDKRPQLWINEVSVAPSHRGQGVSKRILKALLDKGRALGCTEAWVLTDTGNDAARGAYRSAGGEETTDIIMVTFPLDARSQS